MDMEKEMEHKPVDPKAMAEARGLVAKLQALADKAEVPMEHLIEMASDEAGMESESEDEGEGEGASMPDKGKIALIIAKMKGAKGGEGEE